MVNQRTKEIGVNNRFSKERNNQRATDEASKYCINEQIRSEKIIVITQNGDNLGATPRMRALQLAEEAGLDLVQVGENDGLPVTKIMNFGKFLYEKKKQLSDAKKHQKVIQLKEIKIRPNIGDQDFNTKLNQAEQFFKDGNKVKFTLQFRGREISMMEDLGKKVFTRITNDLTEKNVGTLVEEKESRGGSLWSKIYFLKGKS